MIAISDGIKKLRHIQFFNFSESGVSWRLDVNDDRQILLLLLSEYKWINELLFPLKSSKNKRGSAKINKNNELYVRTTIFSKTNCIFKLLYKVSNF